MKIGLIQFCPVPRNRDQNIATANKFTDRFIYIIKNN